MKTKKIAFTLTLIVLLSGLTGFFVPQQLTGVQRLQAVFTLADEQLLTSAECNLVAQSNSTVANAKTSGSCGLIVRARDIYDGVSYKEARATFERGLLKDQLVFAAIFSFLASLTLLLAFGLRSVLHQLRHPSPQTKEPQGI